MAVAPASVEKSYDGSGITLSAAATATEGATVDYRWSKDGVNIEGATITAVAAETDNYNVSNTASYTITVSEAGTTTSAR